MIHGDLLGERARLTPHKVALVDVATGARLDYAALDARALNVARILRAGLRLEPGDRVALLASNRLEYLDIVFATAKAGTVLVPLGTRLTAHELEHILTDSGARVVLYDRDFSATIGDLETRLSDGRRWMSLDQPLPGHRRFEEMATEAASCAWTPHPMDPEALYALLYTSGTTGRPKGVMIPHRMVSWNAYNTVACWQLREDDVSPIFTPLYHAGALGAFLTPIIAIGGTIVLHRAFEPAEVWRTIVDEQCTVVLAVPTIWKMLLEAPQFETADLTHVRWFISGGAPLPEYITAAFQSRGVTFKQGYGLTEVGVNCFSMTVDESVRKRGSIGKPLMMTQARLVDENGGTVPAGEIGELCLKGPHVCRGYWNAPDATVAALDASGWFHTGDLARVDEDGFFYIAGRRKDMFISGGVNVYPAEIEAELLQEPNVADAAVIGVPHATWGEVGVAFVVLRPGLSASPETLLAHLAGRLAKYKLPKEFRFVDALPRTAYGKVQKSVLQQQFTTGSASATPDA